jgi:Helix-turn-helix
MGSRSGSERRSDLIFVNVRDLGWPGNAVAGLVLRMKERARQRGAFWFRRVLTSSSMSYGPPVAMLPTMLEKDRRRAGWSVGQAASRLRVSVRAYRELEAGDRSPSFDVGPDLQDVRLASDVHDARLIARPVDTEAARMAVYARRIETEGNAWCQITSRCPTLKRTASSSAGTSAS